MKKKIRLTEGDLHRIIKRAINEAFEGYNEDQWGDDFDDGLNHTKPNPFKKAIIYLLSQKTAVLRKYLAKSFAI
jgi:hypothetical protein